MASNSIATRVAIQNVCAAYTGADVTITAPGPGTVVVWAAFMIQLDHSAGSSDEVDMYLEDTAGSCLNANWAKFMTVYAQEPTGIYWDEVSMIRPFAVAGPGTYTYHVNGQGFGGVGAGDNYQYASLVAVYYPS
jgi:hypothetical protein